MNPIRIFIVDDHPVLRRGLKSLLSNYDDFSVLGEAADITSAKAALLDNKADVVLLDIRLVNESGLDLLDWIKRDQAETRVIILSSFDDNEYIQRALRTGADGFILKSGSDELLCDAVRTVYRDGRVLSPEITEALLQSPETAPEDHDFNDEELQILRLLVDGESNEAMAAHLYMSIASLKRRLHRIFVKLNVDSRVLAIAETLRRKVLD
jgi:DNA-binding NarL/FixJ family response regulator